MASCDWLLSPSIPFARFAGSRRAWVLRSFFLLRASPSAARADHVSLTDHRLVDVWVRLLRCSRGSPWGGSRFSVYHDRCRREHSPTRLRVDVSSLLRGLYTCKRNCGVICRSVLHGLRTRQTFPQQLHRFRRQRLSASAPGLVLPVAAVLAEGKWLSVHLLLTHDAAPLFVRLFVRLLPEMSVKIHFPFLIGLFVSLVESQGFFLYSRYKSLLRYIQFANILRCLFTFLMVNFEAQNFKF